MTSSAYTPPNTKPPAEEVTPVVNIIFRPAPQRDWYAGECFERLINEIRDQLVADLMKIPASVRTVPEVHKKIETWAKDRLFNIAFSGYDVIVDIPHGPRSIKGRDVLI